MWLRNFPQTLAHRFCGSAKLPQRVRGKHQRMITGDKFTSGQFAKSLPVKLRRRSYENGHCARSTEEG